MAAKSRDDDWLAVDEDEMENPNTAAAAKSSLDIDRDFDRKDFLRLRLKIFKDEYRETAHDTEEASTQQGFDEAFRRCVGFCRRLGKAKGALTALTRSKSEKDKSILIRLLEQIDSCLDKIRHVQNSIRQSDRDKIKAKRDGKSEFDMEFANRALPKYDAEDMELFLGVDDVVGNENDLGDQKVDAALGSDNFDDVLSNFQKAVDEILVSACDALHSRGVCDGFIYA